MELTLVPAYGRDYKTSQDLIKDWEGGKDFRIATALYKGGSYTSIRDLQDFPGEHVKIRFNKLADFILVRISDGHITEDEYTP